MLPIPTRYFLGRLYRAAIGDPAEEFKRFLLSAPQDLLHRFRNAADKRSAAQFCSDNNLSVEDFIMLRGLDEGRPAQITSINKNNGFVRVKAVSGPPLIQNVLVYATRIEKLEVKLAPATTASPKLTPEERG